MLSFLHNLNCSIRQANGDKGIKPKTVSEFHPYREFKSSSSRTLTPDNFDNLLPMFDNYVKGK